ncbi:MAG TPA: rhodanese-like domain-containing protein [Ignavibacteria bacterium]|nr:rhodanese-like domain-containing protein [Ignavibacteria bacterium]
MNKTIKEILIILVLSTVTGLIANALSSKGIPLSGDYADRKAIDTAKINSVDLKQKGKLNKDGFYQPVNISAETAKQLFDDGAVFIDGRLPEEFTAGHIKGAINLDYKVFKDKTKEEKIEILKDVKKDQLIVSYCGSDSCEISIDNGYEIAKAGYDYVKIYLGGYKDWKNKGYPTEK